MCGFVWCFKDTPITDRIRENIKEMSDCIIHRGPDQDGFYSDETMCLSFKRLSIIELENGRQPYSWDKADYHVIFNGEIYNYLELQAMMIEKGYTFNTNTEIEVICALYNHFGEDFVKYLRGMFAINIWDKANGTYMGFRDPFGIKPFYYVQDGDLVYGASEMKSLMARDNAKKEIKSESLHNYLSFQYVPEPDTIFSDVKLLPPGHIFKKKLGEPIEIKPYNIIEFAPVKTTEEEKLKKIRRVLEDSVEKHMLSDVPVGSFLSGGVDSTIVTAIASKIKPDIKTFTVGFEVNGYSEIELAKDTAKFLNVENIHRFVTAEEFMREVPRIIYHLDGPVADPAAIPLFFISEEARKHVTVILSGEGADEMFGGYTIYHEPLSLNGFKNVPGPLKKALKGLASVVPEGVKGKSFIERGCTPIEERFIGNANIFKQEEKAAMLKNYNSKYHFRNVTDKYYDFAKNYDDTTKMQYVDINTWLKGDILVKGDRCTMGNSLELRVPFLDKEVFEVARTLTIDEKMGDNTTKCYLRRAFADILPKEATGRKKLGYPVPIRVWLKNELYDWAVKNIKESTADEYINKEAVLKLLEDHKAGKGDYSRKIWTMLVFIIWYEVYFNDSLGLKKKDN